MWRHKNEISEIMGFVWILWKNNVQEAYSPKMSISGQIISEIIARLCLETSIQTLLNYFGSTQKKIRRVCMEFSEYNQLTSQRQFAPKCSFSVSRPLGHCSFRISWHNLRSGVFFLLLCFFGSREEKNNAWYIHLTSR